jgi:hypothetical protein
MKFRNLLVNIGLAAANATAKWEPLGIASLIVEAYNKHRAKQGLRQELEALLQADFQRFRAEVADVMGELRLHLASGIQVQVETYLSQFQASARQAAQFLGDPSGTTVPATVGFDDPRQLLAFLPQQPPRFKVGASVPGLPSWKLTEPLGTGGFGEVWKAENTFGEPQVAAFKFFMDPHARERFSRQEAATLIEIHSKAPTEGIVKLLAAEPGQDPPWLQFEYVSGGDLSRLPDLWRKLSDAERVKRVRGVIRTLAATTGHFHKLGIVHRDLKPSNVLLRKTPTGYKLVVADFGISRFVPVTSRTSPTPTDTSHATIRAFTPTYASPQQKKFLPADRRDDVYALGVLWYQLLRDDLALERPCGDGWKSVLTRLGVSAAEIALMNRCWDDEPQLRPADGNELADQIA